MPEKLEQASNFANKLWNAGKFIINNISTKEEIMEFAKAIKDRETGKYRADKLKIQDRWILNKLDNLIITVTKNIEEYDLGIALDNIYSFVWNEFCDWYIEMAKTRLYSENKQEKVQVSFILNYVFGDILKLLHPFMPFVTSKLYSNLVNYDDKELMISNWPKMKQRVDYDENKDIIEKVKEIIIEIRNIRNNKNIHPSKKSELIFVTSQFTEELIQMEEILLKLGFGNKIIIKKDKSGLPENTINIIKDGIELYIPLNGLIDLQEEHNRLLQEKERLEAEVARCEKMLSNPGFVNKAPESKINEEKAKLEKYKEMLQKVIDSLS